MIVLLRMGGYQTSNVQKSLSADYYIRYSYYTTVTTQPIGDYHQNPRAGKKPNKPTKKKYPLVI
jgi:hypothetical protein